MTACTNCGRQDHPRHCAGMCWPCYMKWRRNPDYVPDLVDSTEVRRHVAALVESGASLASIARTADLSNPTVYALMGDTPPRRVKITTARALLSVRAS